MSFFAISMNLLFGLPYFYLTSCAILCPVCPLLLLCTYPNHPNLTSLAFSPNYVNTKVERLGGERQGDDNLNFVVLISWNTERNLLKYLEKAKSHFSFYRLKKEKKRNIRLKVVLDKTIVVTHCLPTKLGFSKGPFKRKRKWYDDYSLGRWFLFDKDWRVHHAYSSV